MVGLIERRDSSRGLTRPGHVWIGGLHRDHLCQLVCRGALHRVGLRLRHNDAVGQIDPTHR
jgi:hypothetical protein